MSDASVIQQQVSPLASAKPYYSELESSLKKLRIRYNSLVYLRGLFSWLTVISSLLVGWFLLFGMLELPGILRAVAVLIWSGCAIWAGYIFVIRALVSRASDERMAFIVEQQYPQLQDRLVSSLQLWREFPENRYGYSESFVRAVIEEARRMFEKVDVSRVLSDRRQKLLRSGLGMAGGLLLIMIAIVFFPSTFIHSLATFVNPFEADEELYQIKITQVIPGNCIVQPGDDVEITASAIGPVPADAELYYKVEGGEWNTISIARDPSFAKRKADYTTKLNNVKETMEYYISIANAQSPKYLIKVTYPPVVSNLNLKLHYPQYLGLSPRALDTNVGDISAPLGTKVSLTAESNKDIVSASLVFDDNKRVGLGVENLRELNGSFLIERSGKYYISITDIDGQSNPDPIRYSINAVEDQPPRVSIIYPGESITIGKDMTIPLQIEAQDDHGIAKISLHYQIEGQGKKNTILLGSYSTQQVRDLETLSDIFLKYVWDLLPLQLFPEDVVSYYVEASDFDNVSGPNTGRSPVFTARFPSLYEIYKQTEKDQESQESQMEDILSRQEDVKNTIDDIVKELESKNELDWASKKELERAVEMQKKIEEQMKSLAQQVDETTKKLEENPLVSTKVLEKLQELRSLINELATDEMRQIMRKLSEALEKINISKEQRDLISASFKQEEFIEKLDRMIDLFKNMRFKQKLEVLANQAKELAQRQAEIVEQSKRILEKSAQDREVKSNELAEREMRIKDQTEQLQDDLDELIDEVKERSSGIAKVMEDISEHAKKSQIPDQLQRASMKLKDIDPAGSIPFQMSALSKLSKLQSELQNVASALEGQDISEIISALHEVANKSLYLSHRHEEVMSSTTSFSEPEEILPNEKKVIDSLAADQIALAESVRKVADQVKVLSHRSPLIRPELVWNLEQVADGMVRSAKALEDNEPLLAGTIQKNALATLNKAIENMLDSMEQISSQAMPMMGLEDYMEQLRQLADQQSQLNQATQNAGDQMRKQGITPSLEELLEKLAAEQSLIREATERLAEKLDQLADAIGRLEEVAKDMREVENDLRGSKVDKETIEKQKRILTRLLEYEKSLKKQDFDRKRESRPGREYMVEKPSSELPPDATKIRKQLDSMLAPSVQERWPAQYRELIKTYFKALSNTSKSLEGNNPPSETGR